jgi:hypothetical protein
MATGKRLSSDSDEMVNIELTKDESENNLNSPKLDNLNNNNLTDDEKFKTNETSSPSKSEKEVENATDEANKLENKTLVTSDTVSEEKTNTNKAIDQVKEQEIQNNEILHGMVSLLMKFMIYDDQSVINEDRIMMKQQVSYFLYL